MAKPQVLCLLYSLVFMSSWFRCLSAEEKIYVVYLGDKPKDDIVPILAHYSMLEKTLGSMALAKDSLVYSYSRSFNGFAAKLSDKEIKQISEMDGVVSILPNAALKLHTTRSWDFMGFSQQDADSPRGGQNLIIGMIDTGIWPESESFRDDGLGPPPAKWKGICQPMNTFMCNNKIIGARFYSSDPTLIGYKDVPSPRDTLGHGSHTSAIAAGRNVTASYYGLAEGNARGGVPGARIVVYKACWEFGCATADVLAAFDDAIADGVDLISASLGLDFPSPYLKDPVAIGSFHAMRHGILTSASAGNDGPVRGAVTNGAPWSLTVAASTIDRKFVSQLVLGNGEILTGIVINNFEMNGTSFPLIWGGDAPNITANEMPLSSSSCLPGQLNTDKVKGKIVVCDFLWGSYGVLTAGALGTVMPANPYYYDVATSLLLPTTLILEEDYPRILNYIKYAKNPTATILRSEGMKDRMAPTVVSLSSRGPNTVTPDILKPDLAAPGVGILSAWSPLAPPSGLYEDHRNVMYNINSGTSMSCPHVTGAAAYLKTIHPSWSPAALKSALMTTSSVMDPGANNEKEFAYGSGHLNPTKAADPGLVFDASEADYIDFLCKQGYNTSTLQLITGDNSVCNNTEPGRPWDLNYPSFCLAIIDGDAITGTFTRTVTNVGPPNSTYYAHLSIPDPLRVNVEPELLSFSDTGEKRSFTVRVSGPEITQQPIVSGSITWKDGIHEVRTPLAVYTVLPSAFEPSDILLTDATVAKFKGFSFGKYKPSLDLRFENRRKPSRLN